MVQRIYAGYRARLYLQKARRSIPGSYIRELTRKCGGEFSIGPMLMALIGNRNRGKKSA